MEDLPIRDLTVSEILQRWPQTAEVFLRYQRVGRS